MAKTGRKEHEPTVKNREFVKTLAAFGMPQDHIATVMKISSPTLRKHYREELDVGSLEANVKVAESLFRMATNKSRPNVTAAIFWLKTRAGWKETQGIELSNPDGKPIEHTMAIVDEKKIAAALHRIESEY